MIPAARAPRALLPLSAVAAVVVLVSVGAARGIELGNLHNGLLALAFALVGAHVLRERPRQRTGPLFLATGVVEAVMFTGRQVAHFPGGGEHPWWAWLGVWPVAVSLGLVTLCVLVFPDGRPAGRGWRLVAAGVVVVCGLCALTSALWPVEYASAGVTTGHPFAAATPEAVEWVWSLVAHPVYLGLQVLWVVALASRWRGAGRVVRTQLLWLAGGALVSLLALVVGLVGWRAPVPGLLAATLVPVAAGWAIVHAQHRTTYAALTWLTRSGDRAEDRPTDLARTAAEAFGGTGAVLWLGPAERLHAVGVWPERGDVAPSDVAGLGDHPLVRPVVRGGRVLGALSVTRAEDDPLSVSEERLLGHLLAHAGLVLEHLDLAALIASERSAGRLEGLSPREQQVLDLMAQGLSNSAICRELHLSIKTVEPIVGTIFGKLRLHPDAGSNRRVLAVLAYLREG